ncbi:MAG: transglycosylase SLT domain-containing protein [Pseudobdellovibrionaceae bacterium]
MSLAQFLSAYVNLNLMLAFGFLLLLLQSWILKKVNRVQTSKAQLRWHYQVLFGILILACLQPFFPKTAFFEPPVKHWASSEVVPISDRAIQSGYIALSKTTQVNAQAMANSWMVIGSLIFLFGFLWMGRDFRTLFRIQKQSYRIRQYRDFILSVHDRIQVPFSYWWPGQMQVVIPTALLSKPKDFQMAVMHEIQHHRQGDTRFVYLIWMLRLICLCNPFIHLWNKWLCEIQEFACDETLVDQNKVESQAYARCLVEVAQTAVLQKYRPACASGMVFLTERHILQRRIEKMFSKTKNQNGRSIGFAFALVLVSAMVATSYASNGWISDRRVTLQQATKMVEKAKAESAFPVVINDLVLEQLNRYLGTPEGRDFMRDSLQRMETYRVLNEEAFKKYAAPLELAAVPIVESGYQNLSQKPNSRNVSAGLWQFIPQTARNYGLRVDAKVDDRLNPELLTDAAMRYLQANHLRFKDWQLALLAYNMGEGNLQSAIDKVGSNDAWVLIRAGFEGDRRYLAKVMAAVLIMKNPETLQ